MTDEAISTGQVVEDFVNSDVGRFITKRADAHRRTAIAEFSTVDVTNISDVQRIQTAINTTDLIMNWFHDALLEYKAVKIEIDKKTVLS